MQTPENDTSAVLAIREALTGGNIGKAESQLAIIANQHGDEQLALVVKELQPGEVAAVVRFGDYTKPSIVVNFITPEQFIGALERLGASWGSVDKETTLRPMLEQVEDFICSTLLATEGVQKDELIEAFLDHGLGESIVVLLCDYDALRFAKEDESETLFEKGTWQELLMIIKGSHSKTFKSITATLEGFRSGAEGVNDEADENKRSAKVDSYTLRTLRHMVHLAKKHVSVEPVTEVADPRKGFGDI